jgi:hypothetical protein
MVSAWGNETVHLAGLGIVVLLVFAAFWRIAKAIEKHPALALMDGSEIITYHKLQLAKGNPSLPIDSQPIPDPVLGKSNLLIEESDEES